MQRTILIVALILAALVGLFFADKRNQSAVQLALQNAAVAKPVAAGVAFKVPFLPDGPTPPPFRQRYPARFMWGDDVTMKYSSMDEGYLQTAAINLNDGHEVKDVENEWLAHVRFKFNPPSDPLHQGHALLAVASPAHELAFAHLGQVDFDQVRTIPDAAYLHAAPNELPAIWNLQAGDVVGIKIVAFDTDPYGKRLPATAKPFVAKLRIAMLSHDAVRFDYVYRSDGQQGFPPPVRNPAEDE